MSQRKLKRQLSFAEVLMLGTAGTIAAEIFVLTGHVAGMSGPAAVIALLLVGLLCVGIGLNYCELATMFPETGGALTYVHEAYGSGLLPFLVGSLDCLSSAFYCSLSAVGFAYSLQLFIPSIPIVPTAVATIALFTVLNLLGINRVGKVQIVLGGVLLLCLVIYVVLGLTRPSGFRWEVFIPDGKLFIHESPIQNISFLFATMALIFNAYVGFEIIADDAEEVRDPNRNIPRSILVSVAIITLLYTTITMVTLGTVPWQELAGSESALAQAAGRFWPTYGPALVGLAGIIATLTSVNTSTLAATREAFTMSRDGMWPRFMSRLGRLRTPWAACLVIGAIAALVAAIGLVDFLSYISSSGYLFVVFWASLAMIRLRRVRPDFPRPFRVPFFPVTAYLAAGTCVVVVLFTAWRALAFGTALLAVLALFYYLRKPLAQMASAGLKAMESDRDRILVPVANPHTAEGLAHLAAILAERVADTSVTILGVVLVKRQVLPSVVHGFLSHMGREQRVLFSRIMQEVSQHNVPVRSKTIAAQNIADGILQEVDNYGRDELILMGWPGPLNAQTMAANPVSQVLERARTNVAVLLNRGGTELRRILVPVGGSTHSLLAVRLAAELGERSHARVTALHCFCEPGTEDLHDNLMLLREQVETELGEVPPYMATKVLCSRTVADGIAAELASNRYDLVIMGSAVARSIQADLFGSLTDRIASQIPCSVLLVRRYEPATIRWLRRQVKQIMKD